MASQGPLSPTSVTTEEPLASYGIDWVNPTNIYSSNNSRSTCTLASTPAESNYTYFLKPRGFGFAIPAGSTIDGIVVEIERSDSVGNIQDSEIKLVKGGSRVGTSQSSGANWDAVEAYVTFGSSSNLWGTTWTVSDINAADFGVDFRAAIQAGPTAVASVDHVRITIYYTPPPPKGFPFLSKQDRYKRLITQ